MKSPVKLEDLAINGAPPAFQEQLHVGRPNIGSKEKFLVYASDILDRRWLSNNGPLVRELEKRIADYLDVKHCVCMCNGTVALEIAIRALGLSGEVIIPSFTFIATAHALSWQEVTPVFADIDPQTHTLDPNAVRKMITPRTSGIIGVHLWGQAHYIDDLQEIANKNNLKLMFDAAHAFGCSWNGEMIGNFGECEVFSFHATKFFNALEGGAIVTNDDDLAGRMRLMRNFGFAGMDNVIHPGTNGKMNEMSAAMGLVNFESIDEMVSENRRCHRIYTEELSGLSCIKVMQFNELERNNYQYVVAELQDDFHITQDQLIQTLHAENIRARKYFWPGCHKMKPYRELYPHADLLLSKTNKVSRRVIVLPTGATLEDEEVKDICRIIRYFLSC